MTESPFDKLDKTLGLLGFQRVPLANILTSPQLMSLLTPQAAPEGFMTSPAVHELFVQLLEATDPEGPGTPELRIELTLDEVGQLFLVCASFVLRHQLREHPEHTWIGCTHPVSLVHNVCEIVIDAIAKCYR